jgi:hypothetical protein
VSNSYGYLTNSCSTSKTFILSLPITSSGTKSVSFTGYGSTSSNNVSCKATSMISLGSGYTTSTVSLSTYGSLQTVSLGSLPVNADSTFYLLCTINAGGVLFSVQWDE